MRHPFASPLDIFLAEINGLAVSLPLIMRTLGKSHREAFENIDMFLNKNAILESEMDTVDDDSSINKKTYKVSLEHYYVLENLQSIATNFTAASGIIPRSFIVAMISQYDAFLGKLIRGIYNIKPELLNSSEKNISFSNLMQFGSIGDARNFVLEKEVESVLRESHEYHFEWLEKKLGMELRKGLDIWPVFIELAERRNLFVHTDGIVSSQYMAVCAKHKVNLPKDCQIGLRVDVDQDYFKQSVNCLFEISTKLTQVLWRKLISSEINLADDHLNQICYELLKKEQYELAKALLTFAMNLPRHSSQQRKLVFVINNAISHKWGGKKGEYNEILSKIDWSACSDDFKLAVAALEDRYSDAIKIMYRIGTTGIVKKPDYKDWPVFRDFRKTGEFKKAFVEIFGENIDVVQISNNDTYQLIDVDENTSQDEDKN